MISIRILRPHFFLFFILSLLTCRTVSGATITGILSDSKTKEPIIGAWVKIVGAAKAARSGLDGSYALKNIAEGKVEVAVSYSGYIPFDTTFTLRASEDVSLNIVLSYHTVKAGELTVLAKTDKGSDEESQKTEQNADNVISSVSARTIEVSPDLNVANVLQRVSGVSITRTSSGDAQYAIIRGMDKRYNYTLVNGFKIPSPDNKNRYVPLDIFPSDLLERLEVTKSLIPSMEGDAIGGAMNLVMKDAPDEFMMQANAATGYNSFFSSQKFNAFDVSGINPLSPREAPTRAEGAKITDFPSGNANYTLKQAPANAFFGLTLGDRFFENKSLGVLLAGSYQNSSRGANTIFFESNTSATTNNPLLTSVEARRYSIEQTRAGVNGKIDYRLNEDNVFDVYGTYVSLTNEESRDKSDTNLSLGRVGPGTGRVNYSRRSSDEIQTIGNAAISGDHTIFGKDLRIKWSAQYASAIFERPDRVDIDVATGVVKDSAGKLTQNPSFLDLGSSRDWTHNSDIDKTGYLTLISVQDIFKTETELSVGGMYRAKNRSSFYDTYNIQPDPSPQIYDGDITHNTFTVFDPLGSSTDPLNYDSHENVYAVFGQFKFQIGNLLTIGGLRVEHTDFGWVTAAPVTVDGKTGSISYFDYLPSISFKFMPTADQNWRLSYFASTSRPGFFEVIPYTISGEDYTQIGNPFLKRVQADNVDLRYEYFPGGLDQILIGAFYKRLANAIEYALETKGSNTDYIPDNFGTATNFGFEVDLTKYIAKFGAKLNYTYTNSTITTDKIVRYQDATGNLTERTQSETRPLQGQSAHIGNLSLLYKDFDIDCNAQIGLVYTGPRIVTVSPYYGGDYWQRATTQLDFSAEKGLVGKLTLFAKVTNILNSPYEVEIRYKGGQEVVGLPEQTPGQNLLVRRDIYDRTYQVGVRYKF